MRKLLLFLLILLGLLQYRLWFGDSNLLDLEATKQRLEELEQRAHERQQRNIALDAEIMDLKHGTDAIEELARFDLGMIRANEHFIQVLENPPQEETAPENKKPAHAAMPKTKTRHNPKPAETANHQAPSYNHRTSDE
jgi:cell division protein FtsB